MTWSFSSKASATSFINDLNKCFCSSIKIITSQISLTGDYTVGVRFKPTGTVANYAVLGDNTTAGHFIKLSDSDTIFVKSGSTVKGISITDSCIGLEETNELLLFSNNKLFEIFNLIIKQKKINRNRININKFKL